MAPDRLLTHSMWLDMKGHLAGKTDPKAHMILICDWDCHLKVCAVSAAP